MKNWRPSNFRHRFNTVSWRIYTGGSSTSSCRSEAKAYPDHSWLCDFPENPENYAPSFRSMGGTGVSGLRTGLRVCQSVACS